MVGLTRELVCMRVTIPDETGLLFSIPIAKFKPLINKNEEINFQLIGYPLCESIKNTRITFSFVYNFPAITINGSNFSTIVPYSTTLTNSDGEKILTYCVLYLKINDETGDLCFYDAFYKGDLVLNEDLLPGCEQNYCKQFVPFYSSMLLGNPKDEYDIDMEDEKYTIIVDPLTNTPQQVISRFDYFCPDNPNYPRITGQEVKDLGFASAQDLILQASYIDGQFVPRQSNEYTNLVSESKQLFNQIRQIDFSVSKNKIFNMIFNNDTPLDDVRSEYNEIISSRRIFIDRISQIQSQMHTMRLEKEKNDMISYYQDHVFKNYTAACLLIKDENEYLREWVDHYLNIGVDHLYIYDNDSAISIQEEINGYGKEIADKCTIIQWSPGQYTHMQYDAYANCLREYGDDCRWIGFFDTDEFFELPENHTNINEFLKEYEEYFCVWFPWEVRNANGNVNKPTGKQAENYLTPVKDMTGLFGKVFVQPYRTEQMYVHLASPKFSFDYAVSSNKEKHFRNYPLWINKYEENILDLEIYEYGKVVHYYTRSLEEWCTKITRGSSDPNYLRRFNIFFAYNPDLEYMKHDENIRNHYLGTSQGYK